MSCCLLQHHKFKKYLANKRSFVSFFSKILRNCLNFLFFLRFFRDFNPLIYKYKGTTFFSITQVFLHIFFMIFPQNLLTVFYKRE